MRLCDMKGRFLFEANPYLFNNHEPRARVTADELVAWGAYYEMENKES
jgi:hypothetical protein